MILEQNYWYLEHGVKKTTGFSVTSSDLLKANVPQQMIEAFSIAEGKLEILGENLNSPNTKRDRAKEEEFYQTMEQKEDAQKKIENYLANEELATFGQVDLRLVRKLLSSDATNYSIAKETGLTRAGVGNMRKSEFFLGNMTLKNAIKLTECAKNFTGITFCFNNEG